MSDPPRRIRNTDLAERYDVTPRVASEWIRRLVVDGVASKVGRFTFARLESVDAWVMAGGRRIKSR